jgi:hypothetical protein
MDSGSGPGGGPELLPGLVDQLVPQAGDVSGVLAKPLKDAGAKPPLSVFAIHHCAPQNVTGVPTAALPSPMTKLPPAVADVTNVSPATNIPNVRESLTTFTARLGATRIADLLWFMWSVRYSCVRPKQSNIRLA